MLVDGNRRASAAETAGEALESDLTERVSLFQSHNRSVTSHFMAERETTIKVVLLGDSGVGKTSISRMFTSETMNMDQAPTVGASFTSKSVTTSTGQSVKLNIWDTAGQERFRSLAPIYYRDSHAVVIVYSITDQKTYENLPYWLEMIRKNLDPPPYTVIVGNKSDLTARQVENSVAQAFARQENCPLIETSAVTGQGVSEVFTMVAENAFDRPPSRSAPELRSITAEAPAEQKKQGCC